MKALNNNKWNYKQQLFRIFSVASMVSIIFTVFSLYFVTKSAVAVEINGEWQELSTHASTVEELLHQLDVDYKEHDYVVPDLNTKLENNLVVKWSPSYQVTLIDADNNSVTKWTTEKTVADFLVAEGVPLGDYYVPTPGGEAEITDDLIIKINRAFDVTVLVDGEERQERIFSMSVQEILDSLEINLGDLDRVTPDLTENISENSTIEVVRVVRSEVEVEEEIPYETERVADDSLVVGEEKVVQKGEVGLERHSYEIILENGIEVSRTEIGVEIVNEAVAKIINVGKKPKEVPVVASDDSSPQEYLRTFVAEATAYSLTGTTATGFNLTNNMNAKIVAVDPKVIPLGTKLYVEGYGYATAADTGGKIKGNIIDIHMSTNEEAVKWGRKNVRVYILT